MKRFLLISVAVLISVVLILKFYLIYAPVELAPNNTDPDWDSGSVIHLLPTANHNRILIKASFTKALTKAPQLVVNGKGLFKGQQTDTRGYFWYFDASGLTPSTTYQLGLQDAEGKRLCDPWPMSTFPGPEDTPEHLRLLIFTGLGGHDVHIEWFGTGPLPLSTRTRLLKRALSFNPHAMVSSGDQIYYDLLYDKSSSVMGGSPRSIAYAGKFDRSKPVLGTQNEAVLTKAVGPQIAYLYGTVCRSIPTFFLLDDHDYFENDIATEKNGFEIKLLLLAWRSPFYKGGISFPPDNFMLDLGRTAQKLYMPEFLPDENRPPLPGSGAQDRPRGVSECYGTLRYGKLFEGLLYESRRFVTLTGKDAVFTHLKAEKWLINRMEKEDTMHLVHLPAVIFGWSAGKWMEWYPDIRDEDGRLTTSESKYMWQEGWFLQHNRILKAASDMKKCIPLFICGDIHSQAEARILRSGPLDLNANPIVAVASGSLGTGPRGYPSGFRGGVAEPPTDLVVEEILPSVEKNGFVIADFTPEKVVLRFFAWKPPEPLEAIDTLEPYHRLELKVRN